MTVKLIPLASSLSNPAEDARVKEEVADTLGGLKIEIIDPVKDEFEASEIAKGSNVIALMITGGTEHLARAVLSASSSLMLLYHDSLNSLPAALEAASALNVPIARYDDIERVSAYVSASMAHEKLRKTRFTYFGQPSPWLIYSTTDDEDLKRVGLEVERVDLKEFIERAKVQQVDDNDIINAMDRREVIGPSFEDFRTSLKIEKAIRQELKRTGSTAFSIRCFDLLDPLKGTACLALSRLNDEGYTAGCEGDAPAAVSMMILSSLSGRPSFMGNIATVKGKDVTIAHCTSPTSILSDFRYMSHFESGMGVGIAGKFEEGSKMTLLRMDRNLKLMRYGIGRVVKSEWRKDLCRTQVTLEIDGDPSLMLTRPIGNHYSITPGDQSLKLQFLSKMLNVQLEKI